MKGRPPVVVSIQVEEYSPGLGRVLQTASIPNAHVAGAALVFSHPLSAADIDSISELDLSEEDKLLMHGVIAEVNERFLVAFSQAGLSMWVRRFLTERLSEPLVLPDLQGEESDFLYELAQRHGNGFYLRMRRAVLSLVRKYSPEMLCQSRSVLQLIGLFLLHEMERKILQLLDSGLTIGVNLDGDDVTALCVRILSEMASRRSTTYLERFLPWPPTTLAALEALGQLYPGRLKRYYRVGAIALCREGMQDRLEELSTRFVEMLPCGAAPDIATTIARAWGRGFEEQPCAPQGYIDIGTALVSSGLRHPAKALFEYKPGLTYFRRYRNLCRPHLLVSDPAMPDRMPIRIVIPDSCVSDVARILPPRGRIDVAPICHKLARILVPRTQEVQT